MTTKLNLRLGQIYSLKERPLNTSWVSTNRNIIVIVGFRKQAIRFIAVGLGKVEAIGIDKKTGKVLRYQIVVY